MAKITSFTPFVCFWLSASSLGSAPNDAYRPLLMHGEEYANACAPESQKALKEEFVKLKPRQSRDAWLLVSAFLCNRNTAPNQTFIRRHVPRELRVHVENTGQVASVRTFLPDSDYIKDLAAEGHAWSASIDGNSKEMALQYFANEACVKGLVFRFSAGRWILREASDACD